MCLYCKSLSRKCAKLSLFEGMLASISRMVVLQGADVLENLHVRDKQRAYTIIQRAMLDTDYPTFNK